MKTDEDILLVGSCKSIDSTKFFLSESWKKINRKYEPKDTLSKIEMIQKFNSLNINQFDDCDKWINEMEKFRSRLKDTHNKTYDEDDLLTTLYKNLPEGHIYSSLKVSFMRQLTSTNDKLTLYGLMIKLIIFMRDNINKPKE